MSDDDREFIEHFESNPWRTTEAVERYNNLKREYYWAIIDPMMKDDNKGDEN